jgi:predicted ribonuclease YlaK
MVVQVTRQLKAHRKATTVVLVEHQQHYRLEAAAVVVQARQVQHRRLQETAAMVQHPQLQEHQ